MASTQKGTRFEFDWVHHIVVPTIVVGFTFFAIEPLLPEKYSFSALTAVNEAALAGSLK